MWLWQVVSCLEGLDSKSLTISVICRPVWAHQCAWAYQLGSSVKYSFWDWIQLEFFLSYSYLMSTLACVHDKLCGKEIESTRSTISYRNPKFQIGKSVYYQSWSGPSVFLSYLCSCLLLWMICFVVVVFSHLCKSLYYLLHCAIPSYILIHFLSHVWQFFSLMTVPIVFKMFMTIQRNTSLPLPTTL